MINKDLALEMRNNLNTIITAYEEFLFDEMINGDRQIQAVEGLSSRGIIRTIGSSETSKNRVDTLAGRLTIAEPGGVDAVPSEGPLGSPQEGLTSERREALASASLTSEGESSSRDKEPLWSDIEDCIPCQGAWSWGDFNWDDLLDLLETDLLMRLSFIKDLERLFSGNPVLDELCLLLHLFENLCPQDLLAIIMMLLSLLASAASDFNVNLKSMLKDLIGMLLKPYFDGLDNFLSMHAQFLIGQADCIVNAINVATEQLASIPTFSAVDEDRRYLFGNQKVFGSDETTRNDVLRGPQRAANYVQDKARGIADSVIDGYANKIPQGIVKMIRNATDHLEQLVGELQDITIDLLGGEWLLTNESVGFLEGMRDIATLVMVLRTIYALKLDGLCNEDSVRRVIDRINDSQPDNIILSEGSADGDSGGSVGGNSSGSTSDDSNGQSQDSARTRIRFILSSCLQRTDSIEESQLRQWIEELS